MVSNVRGSAEEAWCQIFWEWVATSFPYVGIAILTALLFGPSPWVPILVGIVWSLLETVIGVLRFVLGPQPYGYEGVWSTRNGERLTWWFRLWDYYFHGRKKRVIK
jgi:hypothetical protein